MSVPRQLISIPLVGGINTKTDPKALNAPKLTALENGIFTKQGTIKKRNGYTQLGNKTEALSPATIAKARAIAALDGETLLFDDEKLYSYSAASDEWLDRGACQSVSVAQSTVCYTDAAQTSADRATAGDVTLYAWEDSAGGVRYSLINESTGAVYAMASQTPLGVNTAWPKCIACSGLLFLFWYNTSDHKVYVLRINPQLVTQSLLAGNVMVVDDINTTLPLYDIAVSGSRIVFVYSVQGSNLLKIGYWKTGGGFQGALTSLAITDTLQALAVDVAPADSPSAGQIGVAYGTHGAHWKVRATFFDASSTPPLAITSGTTDDQASGHDYKNIACSFSPGGRSGNNLLNIFFETKAPNVVLGGTRHGGQEPTRQNVWSGTVDSTGSASTAAIVMKHSGLGSKAWRDGNRCYVNIVFDSPLQATYFTMRDDAVLVAKSCPSVAQGLTPKQTLPQVQNISGRQYVWAGIFKRQLDALASTINSSARNIVYTHTGIKEVTLDFDDAQSHRTAQVGKALYVSGGFLQQYDGVSAVESGFHLYPEGVSWVGTNSGVSPSYAYRVDYEWTNEKGEREQSSSDTVLLVNHALPLTLTIPTLAHTAKQGTRSNVSIAVYRTAEDPANDAPFYRVSSTDPTTAGSNNGYLVNDPTQDVLSFVDNMADATLITQELDYQNSGELDNVAPPAASIMAAGKTRIFLAGLEDPNQVQFAKLTFPDGAVAFNDANTVQLDQLGGPITAMAILNDNLIIFKKRHIYVLTGPGPNNLGVGEFSDPELVTSDAGCTNQRSIIATPSGLIFQTDKGIYLLTQQMLLEYVGADVEAYNSQVITAATLLSDSNQARFLTNDGKTLLYDYFYNQWSTFTGHEGVDATLVSGTYLYARGNGTVMRETAGRFTDGDNSFTLRIETSWLKLNGLQGFQRVDELEVVGEYKSPHRLRLGIAYDYEYGFNQSLIWDPATALDTGTYGSGSPYGADSVYGGSGSSVYQARFFMPRQKCESIRYRIEDLPGSPPGESFQITELSLWAGMKKGQYKLPANKSVG